VRGAARRGPALGAALALVVVVVAAGRAIPRDHLARLLLTTRLGTLDAWEESAGGTVAIVREPHPAGAFRRLYIHGVSNSGDNMMSRRYMRLQALLPLLVHRGESKRALVIGLGTGITCGTLLAYPNLEQRVCVELLPAVRDLVGRFEGNFGIAVDPRVEIRIADGRHELLRDPTHWDLITGEPPPPTAASVVNLYSREFYELCRARLAPHGIVAQWLPLMTQNDEDARALVRSFLDVFPHASLWTTELHETLLLGSMEPMDLDVDTIARRLALPPVRKALADVGIDSLAALLATYVTDTAGLERYADGVAPVTDDRPRIEHAGFIRPGEFGRVLRNLLLLRTNEPIGGAGPALWREVLHERALLTTFYQAGVDFHEGLRAQTEPLLRRVLEEAPDNPYYRWFVGNRSPDDTPRQADTASRRGDS
jgi:spermidine synthase